MTNEQARQELLKRVDVIQVLRDNTHAEALKLFSAELANIRK